MCRRRYLTLIALFVLPPIGCSKTTTPESVVEITDEISSVIPLDEGEISLVISAREIFRKGYTAVDAVVSFHEHSGFDSTLSIDPTSHLAILTIPVSELTKEEADAFSSGVTATILVRDASESELSRYDDDKLQLDDSNIPLGLDTQADPVIRAMTLHAATPYLLVQEESSKLVTSYAEDGYDLRAFRDCGLDLQPCDFEQEFYFTPDPASGPNAYFIEHRGYDQGTFWYIDRFTGWVNLAFGARMPDVFFLEQDADGWMRIRVDVDGTNHYLRFLDRGGSGNALETTTEAAADRYRLITDDINWSLEDRETVYHQPGLPPTKLDFAYKATLRNCSSATLTETIGRTESRTRTTVMSTTESFQLFSSSTVTWGAKVSVEAKARFWGTEWTGKAEGSWEWSATTSSTETTANTFTESTSTTTEVSRTRELVVPPFIAVEVYDAVQSVENVRIPFTKVLRIRGQYKVDGSTCTGDELATQMIVNSIGGVIVRVGANFVDVSIRGRALMDQAFEAQTEVSELEDPC